jgi:hypothetical protein
MTLSEYEERFRISPPSLRETFVAMRGGPRRRRRQRSRAAVALAGGIVAAKEVAPDHSAHEVTYSACKWRTPMSDQPLYRPQDDRPVTQASVDARVGRYFVQPTPVPTHRSILHGARIGALAAAVCGHAPHFCRRNREGVLR